MIYVWIPKCASRTLHQLFLNLCGVECEDREASSIFRNDSRRLERDFGLATLELTISEADTFRERYPDYKWFSVVRNPYHRVVSNYFNKLNRFARRFRPATYYYAKGCQLLGGPKAWKTVLTRIEQLQRHIPFDEYLFALHQYGIDFDPHFVRQTDCIQFGRVQFDSILRMENLSSELHRFFGDCGFTDIALPIEKKNSTRYQKNMREFYSDATRKVVEELYADDFQKLGYSTW